MAQLDFVRKSFGSATRGLSFNSNRASFNEATPSSPYKGGSEGASYPLPEGIFSIESLRCRTLFLDAYVTRAKQGRGDIRLTQELDVGRMNLGDDHGEAWGWAFFKLWRVAAPNSYALESLRFPGYFVEACDVGSLVDRTHGSLRLLRVAPSNDDSDEMSGGGVSAQNTRRFGKRSESGSGSAVDASTSRRYDPPTETWFTLEEVPAADGISHVYSIRSTKYSKLPSYPASQWSRLSDMANSKAVARAAAAGAGENRGAAGSNTHGSGGGNGGGAVGWYFDANPPQRRGRNNGKTKGAVIRLCKVDEPDDGDEDEEGKDAEARQKSVDANAGDAEVALPVSFLQVELEELERRFATGVLKEVDFEVERLSLYRRFGKITKAEEERRRVQVEDDLGGKGRRGEGSYYRWNWFRFRHYYLTVLFTDIQGSTRLWERFGSRFKGLLDVHHSLVRGIIKQHNGCTYPISPHHQTQHDEIHICTYSPSHSSATLASSSLDEVKTEGDAFMIVFQRPSDAVFFAVDLQIALVDHDWPAWLLEDEEVGDDVGVVLHDDEEAHTGQRSDEIDEGANRSDEKVDAYRSKAATVLFEDGVASWLEAQQAEIRGKPGSLLQRVALQATARRLRESGCARCAGDLVKIEESAEELAPHLVLLGPDDDDDDDGADTGKVEERGLNETVDAVALELLELAEGQFADCFFDAVSKGSASVPPSAARPRTVQVTFEEGPLGLKFKNVKPKHHRGGDSDELVLVTGFSRETNQNGRGGKESLRPLPAEASGKIQILDVLSAIAPLGEVGAPTTNLLGLSFDEAVATVAKTSFPFALTFSRVAPPSSSGGFGGASPFVQSDQAAGKSTPRVTAGMSAEVASRRNRMLQRDASIAVSPGGGSGQSVQPLFRGLRVRVGMFTGEPEVERDEVTKRMDFYGPPVNRAARIEGQADGGQVLICETTYQHCFGPGARRLTALARERAYVEQQQQQQQQLARKGAAQGTSVEGRGRSACSPLHAKANAASASFSYTHGHETYSDAAVDTAAAVAAAAVSFSSSASSSFSSSSSSASRKSTHDPALHAHLAPSEYLAESTIVKDLGVRTLKGISKPEHIYEVLPKRLRRRTFQSAVQLVVTASNAVKAMSPGVPQASSGKKRGSRAHSGTTSRPELNEDEEVDCQEDGHGVHNDDADSAHNDDDDFDYDVFLSHKQEDAQDFCRHLYSILTSGEHKLRVFLDRASDPSLKIHDLPAIIRRSRCFVFVLSSNVFNSTWCLRELHAAVQCSKRAEGGSRNSERSLAPTLLPLRLEGSTWGEQRAAFPDPEAPYIPRRVAQQPDVPRDSSGSSSESNYFDPQPSIRELLKIKAVEHSREYFDVFVQRLVSRLPKRD